MRKAIDQCLLAAALLALAGEAGAQSAGSLTGTVNAARDPRIIQLGLKLYF